MEDYSNGSAIPLLQSYSSFEPSQPIMANSNSNSNRRKRARQLVGAKSDESLKTERDRRSRMSRMFTLLQAIVPGLLPKATKEVIIKETVEYIKELEKKKQKLEELKESQSIKQVEGTNRNCSITLTLSNNVALFGIQSDPRPGFVTLIFNVFTNHHAEILAANVSVNLGTLTLAITAVLQDAADGNGTFQMIKREIMTL